jgi:hypothetical protein
VLEMLVGVADLAASCPFDAAVNDELPYDQGFMFVVLLCRLARLRWRNAFAVLGTWSRQSTIQSGGQRSSKAPGQLLAKVQLTAARCVHFCACAVHMSHARLYPVMQTTACGCMMPSELHKYVSTRGLSPIHTPLPSARCAVVQVVMLEKMVNAVSSALACSCCILFACLSLPLSRTNRSSAGLLRAVSSTFLRFFCGASGCATAAQTIFKPLTLW